MGIMTKGRRNITVDGQRYVWFVNAYCDYQDHKSDRIVLQVFSFDKKFSVSYQLNQPNDKRFVVIKGVNFVGAKTGNCWRRFNCPKWESDLVVKPNIVRAMIQWCLKTDKPLAEVDWKGNKVGRKEKT